MDEIKIEKEVPLPPGHRKSKTSLAQLLATMEPMDSFVVKSRNQRMSVFVMARRHGMQMTTRRISKDKDEYRIWYLGPIPQYLGLIPQKDAFDDERLALPISVLELSARAENCLGTAYIETLSDLVKMSDHDLLRIKNFGKGSLEEVSKHLGDMHLFLARSKT